MFVGLQAKGRKQHEKEAKKQKWVHDEKELSGATTAPTLPRPTPKPVDEDLYKISPELLYAKSRKVQPSFN